jgi:hypothetical protein
MRALNLLTRANVLSAGLAALLSLSQVANARPAAQALLQATQRAPELEYRLPQRAIENSAVVGALTPGLLGAGSIAVTLEDGRTVVARRQREESRTSGSRSWVGTFDDALGSVMVLTQDRGTVTGFIQRGVALYELLPARGQAGQHVLYRVDESKKPQPGPSRAVETGGATIDGTTTSATTAGATGAGTIVDVMVVYTPASRARYGQAELESMILNAFAAGNQAFVNSRIDVAMNLVYLGEIAYTESGDMTKTLTALKETSDGQMDGVHAIRDRVGADLVALVSEDTNWCGFANVMRNVSTSFAAWAFSVTGSTCLSNGTFVHEIGHNLGAHHNWEDAGNGGAYPYSFGLRRCTADGLGFRTVMAYYCSGAARTNSFSDPNIYYNGLATGIAYESSSSKPAENARTLRNTIATAAILRPAAGSTTAVAPAAPASASAAAASDQRINVSWADKSSDESGFRVERSPNGSDWTEIAQVGSNVTSYADTGLNASTWYYYRVRAWNSVGSSAFSNVASAATLAPAPPPPPAPAPPGGVYASTVDTTIVVSWVDQSTNEAGFEVLRETYNSRKGTWSAPTVLKVAIPDVTSLTDSPGAGTYRYSVRTYNAGGNSAWAGPAGATVAGGSKGGGRKSR